MESVDDLVAGLRSGSRAAVARAITLVESRLPAHREQADQVLAALAHHDRRPAIRVGVSGVPGVGKSTFINALGLLLVEQGYRVAVLAVDPSSPHSGGSVLGDRTRMADLARDERAFVRPSPAAGELGGVARATGEVMQLVEAAGFDVVLVETVGVGQSEVAVADLVDTFLLLMLPRAGDQVQGIKRGVLELADVIAVTKADGDLAGEARASARDLAIATKLLAGERRVPVLTCSAVEGVGVDDVWQAVVAHRSWLAESVGLAAHRGAQQRRWMWSLVEARLRDALAGSPAVSALAAEVGPAVERGEVSASEAASRLLSAFGADAAGVWGPSD